MLLKRLALIITTLLCTACAPQRTTFTSKAQASSPAASGSDTSQVQMRIKTPAGYTALISQAQQTALKALADRLDANKSVVAPGVTRTIRLRRRLGGRPSDAPQTFLHRQTITSLADSTALYEVADENNQLIAQGERLNVREFQPIREALRALADADYDKVFNLIALLMARQAGFADLPDDTKAEINVRKAQFMPDEHHFTLVVTLTMIPPSHDKAPRKFPRMTLELHLEPDAPKPFDITYIAYGPAVNASTIVLDVVSVGP